MKIKITFFMGFIMLVFNVILSHLLYTENNEFILSTFLVVLDIIYVGILLSRNKDNKKIYLMIFISLIVRTLLMYFELYGRDIFVLPNSGRDTEAFYTVPFNSDMSSLNGYFLFVRILGILFCKQRIMFQFTNVIFSLLTSLIMLRIFEELKFSKRAKYIGIILISFLPSNMIISVELLREELMILINAWSLYYFILWFKKGNVLYFVFSTLLLVLSAYFHSSMIIAIFGYFFAFISYNRKLGRLVYTYKSIGKLFISFVLFIGLYVAFYSYISSYFNNIGDINYLNDKLSYYVEGNSVYLQSLAHQTSFIGLLLTSPIKFVYFYASPVPWEIRSAVDACIFMFSSIFYVYPYIKLLKKKSPLIKILLIIVTIIGFAYGLSCFSVGSAMRHREKAIPYVTLLIAAIVNLKRSDKDEI